MAVSRLRTQRSAVMLPPSPPMPPQRTARNQCLPTSLMPCIMPPVMFFALAFFATAERPIARSQSSGRAKSPSATGSSGNQTPRLRTLRAGALPSGPNVNHDRLRGRYHPLRHPPRRACRSAARSAHRGANAALGAARRWAVIVEPGAGRLQRHQRAAGGGPARIQRPFPGHPGAPARSGRRGPAAGDRARAARGRNARGRAASPSTFV